MARMKTGRMMSPKTVDPKTGNRIADPEKVGKEAQKGYTYSSWPEMVTQYKQGKNTEIFNSKNTPPEVRDYVQGKVKTLSEKYDEPTINTAGGAQYSYNAEFNDKPVKKVDPPKETIEKMPIKKPKLGGFEPGKLAGNTNVAKKEATAFVNPAAAMKTKSKTGRALTGGGSGLKKVGNETGTLGSARAVKGTRNVAKAGYKREGELFKANAQTSALGKDFNKMTSGEIKDYRKNLKSERRDYRKSGVDADTKQQAITGATMDIRQSRKAEKFAKKAYAGGDALKSFKPSMVAEYKNSTDNANNRNTMDAKIKAAGEKAKRGSFGGMPTS